MAENPLFPGTDIEVVEKYAPGKRLDFPDFSSVCKTTFAKGVITEFKESEAEPETLQWFERVYETVWPYGHTDTDFENDDIAAIVSMVKVEIEGVGESEFIPLFYHPKAEFWDDEDPRLSEPVLATDFDEEQGCFKQAWQSFRVDDEVAVMLKEGVPVAVIGFADAIFQMEYDTLDGAKRIYQWQPGLRGEPDNEGKGQPYGDFNVENKGPDDLALGLKKEALLICDSEKTQTHVDTYSSWGQLYPDGGDYFEVTFTDSFSPTRYFREYFFTIGPVAYVLQMLYQKMNIVKTCSHNGIDVTFTAGASHGVIDYDTNVWQYVAHFSIWSKVYSKEIEEEAIELGATHEGKALFTSPDDINPDWDALFYAQSVPAGIDCINPVFGDGNYSSRRGPLWNGWVFQPDWSIRFGVSYLQDSDATNPDQINGSTLKIFTRPHTKAELQDCGIYLT
jgi:hypothetical protein